MKAQEGEGEFIALQDVDEWDSLRLKIKQLETNFLRGPAEGGVTSTEVPAADFWKIKYEKEREDWEKALGAKARAFLQGRGYVTPQDVKDIAMDVMRHRVIVTYEAEAEEKTAADVVRTILDNVPVP